MGVSATCDTSDSATGRKLSGYSYSIGGCSSDLSQSAVEDCGCAGRLVAGCCLRFPYRKLAKIADGGLALLTRPYIVMRAKLEDTPPTFKASTKDNAVSWEQWTPRAWLLPAKMPTYLLPCALPSLDKVWPWAWRSGSRVEILRHAAHPSPEAVRRRRERVIRNTRGSLQLRNDDRREDTMLTYLLHDQTGASRLSLRIPSGGRSAIST